MMNIIITGSSGLVGTKIVNKIKQNDFSLTKLSTDKSKVDNAGTYYWNPATKEIDSRCFKENNVIVNLAGAGIFDKAWTAERKKELYESRVQGTHLLYDTIVKTGASVSRLVNASATGIYPSVCEDVLIENSTKSNSFIAQICKDWEAEALRFESLGIPVSIARIGIVLDRHSGFLAKLAAPVRLGLGAIPGSGRQMVSWIHADDLADFFVASACYGSYTGIYNLAAPEPVSLETITKETASVLKKPLWLPHIPVWALKLALGERAELVLTDQKVSSQKLTEAGFRFQYTAIRPALENLLAG